MPNNEELTQTDILKHYLLEKENAYLLDENNNGKTIMLSGAWGSGKTHFWQKEIEPKLKETQIAIYVSLYGKESINEIKFDIFKEAYNSQVKEDIISKSASLFHSVAPSFGEKSLTDGFEKLNTQAKTKKATELLQQGSVICFDDFERKSEKINLNDLFGFISQLSIDLGCKTVIILNSEVFIGKEAEIFTNVKEKTISKFFYFNPTIEELFKSISDNLKYNQLNNYKKDILSAIKGTNELNARIYIQVLDNCLEWLEIKKPITPKTIYILTFCTISFISNNLILKYHYHRDRFIEEISQNLLSNKKVIDTSSWEKFETSFRKYLNSNNQSTSNIVIPNIEERLLYLKENTNTIKAKIKYINLFKGIKDNEKEYEQIIFFIKTGILLP